MHTLCLVFCPPGTSLATAEPIVGKMLARHHREWDWYQIGGRWTGWLSERVPGYEHYDPEQDPANIETCPICGGTEQRTDASGNELRKTDPTFTCNGCDGKGQRPTWPTQWQPVEGDCVRASDLIGHEKIPGAVVTPDRQWHESGAMFEAPDATWAAQVEAWYQQYPDHVVVAVDTHN